MLPPETIEKIEKLVDQVFERLKGRYLSPGAIGKKMLIGYMRDFSLPGIYEQALLAEGGLPDAEVLNTMVSTAGRYLEASQAKAKAEMVKAIVAILSKQRAGAVEAGKLEEEIQEELDKQWKKVTHSVNRIIDTETSHARGVGLMTGVIDAAIRSGDEDPVIVFYTVRDHRRCTECTRLHLMPDGVTPRAWYLSEVSHAYHVKGEDFPSIGGLHPHCFTGEMKLHTADKGAISFEELYGAGERILVAADGRVQLRQEGVVFDPDGTSSLQALVSSPVYYTGTQPCYRIELTDGKSVEVSYGHEMWIGRKDTFTKERALFCVPGDVVPVEGGYSEIKKITPLGFRKTYCVTEPMTNTVIVNGIVTGNCRCTLTTIKKGFGYSTDGKLKWIAPDYSLIEDQRGLAKSEPYAPHECEVYVAHEDVCEECSNFQGDDYYTQTK